TQNLWAGAVVSMEQPASAKRTWVDFMGISRKFIGISHSPRNIGPMPIELSATQPPPPPESLPARLNEPEREALLLNVDVSLRVHARAQLFGWVQGALQSLIPHEVLVCGLQESRQAALRVDSFSTAPVEGSRLNELFQQDVSLVPHLIKLWEENRCQ